MLIHGNSRIIALEDKSVHCIITSPPYFSKRDYNLEPQIWGGVGDCVHRWGNEAVKQNFGSNDKGSTLNGSQTTFPKYTKQGQFCAHCHAWRGSLGLESSVELYIEHLIEVFGEIWRVLRDDGTCWVNIGDGHIKKDLCLIPARLALALQADGWHVRSEIIWAKPNPMPSSATDRPAVAHEIVYMLSKRPRYFWDMEAVKESVSDNSHGGKRANAGEKYRLLQGGQDGTLGQTPHQVGNDGRTIRTVWTIPTAKYHGAHFATFPTRLVEPMVKAGTSQWGVCEDCGAPWARKVEKEFIPQPDIKNADKLIRNESNGWAGSKRGTNSTQTTGWSPTCSCSAPVIPAVVLDPFCGSGTVGQVCRELHRRFIGMDLSAKYLAENALPRAERKTSQASIDELPLFKEMKRSV